MTDYVIIDVSQRPWTHLPYYLTEQSTLGYRSKEAAEARIEEICSRVRIYRRSSAPNKMFDIVTPDLRVIERRPRGRIIYGKGEQ